MKKNKTVAASPIPNIYFDLEKLDFEGLSLDDNVTVTVKGKLKSLNKREEEGGAKYSISVIPEDVEVEKINDGSIRKKSKMEEAFDKTQESVEE